MSQLRALEQMNMDGEREGTPQQQAYTSATSVYLLQDRSEEALQWDGLTATPPVDATIDGEERNTPERVASLLASTAPSGKGYLRPAA